MTFYWRAFAILTLPFAVVLGLYVGTMYWISGASDWLIIGVNAGIFVFMIMSVPAGMLCWEPPKRYNKL